MRARSLVSTLLSVVAVSLASTHAGVVVVDASGGGSFTQIQAAVNAASDGDVLLVKPGNYVGFNVASKELDFVADTTAVSPPVHVDGLVTISGLAGTRSVTLSGFEIRGAPATVGVRVSACNGAVRLHTCDVRGGDALTCVTQFFPPGKAALEVEACRDVVATRCTLRGSDGGTQAIHPLGYGGAGGAGLLGNFSSVGLYDCVLVGGVGGSQFSPACPNAFGYSGRGGSGAEMTACAPIFASRCSFQGGDGGVPGIDSSHGGDGLVLASVGAPPTVGSAWVLDSTASGGQGQGPCSVCDGVPYRTLGASSLTFLPGTAKRLVAESVVREQNLTRLRVHGTPGDRVELFVSEAARFAFSTTWRGVLHLRTRAPSAVMQAGTIGANGELIIPWPVSELGPLVQSRRFFLQPSFIDASGQATLGTPHTLVLLDSAF